MVEDTIGGDSPQTEAWASEFGEEYTDRNLMDVAGMEQAYRDRYGVSRTEMNERFIGDLDRGIRILEVGSNIGLQLALLQEMGFRNLYGIDLSGYAVGLAHRRTEGISFLRGSALDIPFKDGYFDLVFTSGLLIHINPGEIKAVMSEMYRCSSKYIWGFEYFSTRYLEVEYRKAEETTNLLWKGDFHTMFLGRFDDLRLSDLRMLPHLRDTDVTAMYLLQKDAE
ncbi:hypothetical protein LCGC14_0411470 [marine sediment metagenome]|uniref:Methyltransferase domain-containing protein n=1 Tax=marine sediment metagenome TaxID=412755 RepID=A0A0F9STN9_9ZZZZ